MRTIIVNRIFPSGPPRLHFSYQLLVIENSSKMPRPPKKKAKKNAEVDEDFTFKNARDSVQQAESSDADDLKNLASIMKVKRTSKAGNQSFENFERKCNKLLETATKHIEQKIDAHEENIARLYGSVEEINEEVEPTEDEARFERIINKNFDTEISYLSRALTDMNAERSDELQIDSELLEQLNTRPEQLAEFSRRMTAECKRGFRMYYENNKLVSDSRKFKEKYRNLMKEAL
ncbi:hypothetical protein PtA15_11A590 [Puccinia triticina]|uniref:Uncharacterized protein n=1 Tax=Puccinia triticina TaxID=208348 RepID=A0ABY7CYC1_9BASI|nr:uncharacterized protein PtA15_11A590 [Puccinia triticina]WAQ89898.1 hypothetical protein PtA15_11A590 [Puccinia triticina]